MADPKTGSEACRSSLASAQSELQRGNLTGAIHGFEVGLVEARRLSAPQLEAETPHPGATDARSRGIRCPISKLRYRMRIYCSSCHLGDSLPRGGYSLAAHSLDDLQNRPTICGNSPTGRKT